MKPEISNTKELDVWLFDHAHNQGHKCESIKDIHGNNIAWVDTITGERIDICLYKP